MFYELMWKWCYRTILNNEMKRINNKYRSICFIKTYFCHLLRINIDCLIVLLKYMKREVIFSTGESIR